MRMMQGGEDGIHKKRKLHFILTTFEDKNSL